MMRALAIDEVDELDELHLLVLHRSTVLFALLDAQAADGGRPGFNYPMRTVACDALTELARDIVHAAARLEQILDEARQSTEPRRAALAAFVTQPPAGPVQ